MTAPTCLGKAMTEIGRSGAGGPDCALLIWLVQACDWDATDGETFTSIETLADRAGVSRSTFIDAAKRLVAAGVVVVRHRPGTSAMRRIDWEALEYYTSPKSSKGGVRVKGQALTDERSTTDDRSPTRPMDGLPLTDERSAPTDERSQPTPCLPLDLPNIPTAHGAPVPAAGLFDEPEASESDGLPVWAASVKMPASATRPQFVAEVVRCIGAVTESTVNPLRCGTAAKSVIGLWKALGSPPIDEFAADFVMVAEAAHRCPVGLFAKDIRAEGWAGGTDRQYDVSTIAVQARWDVRVLVARQWKASTAGSDDGQRATTQATAAWEAMTANPRWKTICYPGGAPNRPGDYGKPDRWDLSDTADEHDRRMTAFLRAGSIPKWQMADAQGRIEFRARWIGFYVDEVKA